MNENNLLIFFNYDDKILNKFKSKFNENSIFDKIYNVSWSRYKSKVLDTVSISSLIDFDKFVLNYVQDYKISENKAYKEIYQKNFTNYSAMLLRRTRKEISFNSLEFRHLFNIHFKFIEKFLITKKIKLILMGPSSSAGFDLLFQLIPKYLNIKVIYAENFHSQKFFYTTKFGDWGYFKNVPKLFEKNKVNIYEKDPIELFYIKQFTTAYNRSYNLYHKILFIKMIIKLLF